jgi:molybdenum cofactor cytidylyltransferase
MGDDNKLLLKFHDKAMVSHVIDQLEMSNISDIIVVTGNEYDEVRKAISQKVEYTHNPDFDKGLSTSLKAGISALHSVCDGVMVCLGDMPYISQTVYDEIISAFIEGQIIVPTSHGKIGNPILFSKEFFDDFQTLDGDTGARGLLKKYSEKVIKVEVGTDSILEDIDTPESYQDILSKI